MLSSCSFASQGEAPQQEPKGGSDGSHTADVAVQRSGGVMAGISDRARVALAGIRIFNGAAALFAPRLLARRLGVEKSGEPMGYPFRMFGIRTILIGADLLSHDEAVRRHATRAAIVVHASDTASAIVTGIKGGLPRRSAAGATAISALNLGLALLANRKNSR
jgi:hypothetical protein